MHNPASLELAIREGAWAVRFIRGKDQLHPKAIEYAQGHRRAGLTVVFTINRWFEADPAGLPAAGSARWNKELQDFETFLAEVGPSIDYISLDNEPLLERPGGDFRAGANGRAPVIE